MVFLLSQRVKICFNYGIRSQKSISITYGFGRPISLIVVFMDPLGKQDCQGLGFRGLGV